MTLALTCQGTGPEKYTVRNASGETLPPGTYFVVRATDIMAPAGLWAYVNTLETVLELAEHRKTLTTEETANLRATADRAMRLASTWQRNGLGRLPD